MEETVVLPAGDDMEKLVKVGELLKSLRTTPPQDSVMPIPEAVIPKDWTIKSSPYATVDIPRGIMDVPLDDKPHAEAVRLHEMAHVRISPEKPWMEVGAKKLSPFAKMCVLALEDFRVNTLLTPNGIKSPYAQRGLKEIADRIPLHAKINSAMTAREHMMRMLVSPTVPLENKLLGMMSVGTILDRMVDSLVEHEGREERGMIPVPNKAVLSRMQNEHKRILKALCKAIAPTAEGEVESILHGVSCVISDIRRNMSFSSVVRGAKRMEKLLKKAREEEDRVRGSLSAHIGCDIEDVEGVSRKLEIPKDLDPISRGEILKAFKEGLHLGHEHDRGKSLEEEMARISFSMKLLPLQAFKPELLSKDKRPEYVGAVPKHMESVPFDGKVFEAKLRGRGGTVLIDNSGSMSLSESDLEQLIMTAPAVTVGVYDGDGHEGALRIVARGGRMATMHEIQKSVVGCGNIVDIFSLRWLAKQRMPRIWVSDGGVTGCMDHTKGSITKACKETVARNGIIRVRSAEDAINLFRKMSGKRTPTHQMILREEDAYE